MPEILVHRDGAVGTVIISNPDKFNAMTTQMWRDLPRRIAELDADPAVHAIVLRGDGDKAFVSGADISQFGVGRGDAASQQAYGEAVDAAYMAPVVSLIGVQNTLDIFYSARIFDAAEALRIGFVSRVVPAAQLEEQVRALVQTIAENAPLTARAVKLAVNACIGAGVSRNPAPKQLLQRLVRQ